MGKIKETVLLPIKGEYKTIEHTPDQVFSNKFLGEGFVIFPETGVLKSPVNGIIKSVFQTKHAITLTSSKGLDILIHIGLETVKLNGEGFTLHVEEGQKISQGDVLIEFDIDYINEHADSSATPFVFVERTSLKTKKVQEKNGNTYLTIVTE